MPLYSYECEQCGYELEYLMPRRLKERECDICGGRATPVFKKYNISYGVTPVSAKGEYMPGLGRTFNNTFEYKKALDAANQMEASPKELREFQQRKKTEGRAALKKTGEVVKKEVMNEIQAGRIRRRKNIG